MSGLADESARGDWRAERPDPEVEWDAWAEGQESRLKEDRRRREGTWPE